MAKKKRVLIIGGGFAGLHAAKTLNQHSRFETELINANNYFVFQPLLPEAAAGVIAPPDAVSPLRFLLPGVTIRHARVRSIDFKARRAETIDTMQRIITHVRFDHLVLAPGQISNLSHFPGLAEHGLSMKNLSDAYRLRNHIIATLEQADVTTNPELKRQLLTYVTVGGGFSGVETTGEIEHMIGGLLRFYPRIKRHDIRIILIEYAGRILGELPEKLAHFTHSRLTKRGVDIRLNTKIEAASAYGVHLAGGQRIKTATIISTIGAGPSPFVERLGLDMQWGRIKTDPMMRVPGVKNVWAIGDAALIPLGSQRGDGDPEYAQPTAQFATRQGHHVAHNIIAVINGNPPRPFSFRPRGALASIGRHHAVASVFGIQLSGTLAWFLWRLLYLGLLPGISAKLRLMSSWLLDHFLPRRAVQLEQWRRPAASYAHFVKGDQVLRPGMITEGFYTILEGSFDLRIKNPQTGKMFHRILRKGDHFGERVIFDPSLTTGHVIAREDSVCMVLERHDFLRFAQGFPFLDSYFRDYITKNFPAALRPENINPPKKQPSKNRISRSNQTTKNRRPASRPKTPKTRPKLNPLMKKPSTKKPG